MAIDPLIRSVFRRIASQFGARHRTLSLKNDRRCRYLFGVTDIVTSDLWKIIPRVSNGNPKHLLQALLFLKTHDTEHLLSWIAGCDEKTLRKWSKKYLSLL